MEKQFIKGGVYVVVDPAMEEGELLGKLREILPYQPAAVQIWDHFKPETDEEKLCRKITEVCGDYRIPVLINNRWKLAKRLEASGVHFDEIPNNFKEIKQELYPHMLIGLTLNNQMEILNEVTGIDYISFCSIFDSPTNNSCELVNFETVKQVRKNFNIPIFLSGGITPENIPDLKSLEFDGIAVVSGIMNVESPEKSMVNYKNLLQK